MEGADFCVGTSKADTLKGSEDTEEIYGLSGDDLLYGNGGDDTFSRGKGIDTIGEGEAGADKNFIDGSAGNDYLGGGTRLYGAEGSDTLEGFTSIRSKRPARILDDGSGEDDISSSGRAP